MPNTQDKLLALLTHLFTTTVELADVKHIRFNDTYAEDGGACMSVWDNDGELGHLFAEVSPTQLERHECTRAGLITFLAANGARRREKDPLHF
jgi:hypothetical protein